MHAAARGAPGTGGAPAREAAPEAAQPPERTDDAPTPEQEAPVRTVARERSLNARGRGSGRYALVGIAGSSTLVWADRPRARRWCATTTRGADRCARATAAGERCCAWRCRWDR